MLAFIQNFTPSQIDQFWFPFTKPKTVCRMYISIKNKGVELFKVDCYSENDPGQQHAEEVAYNEISRKLFTQSNEEYLNDEFQLDFAITMNNSSCKGCREKIIDWIKRMKQSMHGAHLQLILFFSNLYVGNGEETSVEEVVVSFTGWVIHLVKEYSIFVDICPIIVSKMLPKRDYYYTLKDLPDILKRDITCLENFRKLFEQLTNAKDGAFSVQSLHYNEINIFDVKKPVNEIHLKIFTWESPQGISVRPIGDKYFPPLNPPLLNLKEYHLIESNTAEENPKKMRLF